MWDERYSSKEYFYGKEPNDFLRESLHFIQPGKSVLCLAEGEGRNAVFVAQAISGVRVTAVDASIVGLEKTQQLAREKNVVVSTIHADLAVYDLGIEQWDTIISIWCHLPSQLRKQVHAAIVRALKPGGRLILEAYTPQQLKHGTGGPKSPEMLMQLSELKLELEGLSFVVGHECEREIHEGHGHFGTSSVVQVIAEKMK